MRNLKPLMGIGIAILFVLLGLYLIQKEDKTAIIVGYANVIFFSGIILLAVIKLFKKQ